MSTKTTTIIRNETMLQADSKRDLISSARKL